MKITQEEVEDLKKFIFSLNSKKDSAVIVEGKKDKAALRSLGCSGKILEFHKFQGFVKFGDSVSHYQSLIFLLDNDRKGSYLTARLIEQLEHRTKIDLSFKRKLKMITKGKVRFIENLSKYESFV